MIWQKAELYNAAGLIEQADGGVSWLRVPAAARDAMETDQGKRMAGCATGVELRFVLKGEQAVIRMRTMTGDGIFHVYRGGIQGGWEDHEVHKMVGTQAEEFVIRRSENMERLKVMTEQSGLDWDCEVIRVIFDRGYFELYGIEGDIEPPRREQCPEKTLMAYGSSITHGSNSLDQSHSWVSLTAHALNMDARNLGMAGSCWMEPEIVDYVAAEGEKGAWDLAILELGINVMGWEEEKFLARVKNTVRTVAGRNPDKPVFVISPFYYCGETFDASGKADRRRAQMEEIGRRMALKNVEWINGLEILDSMAYISADEVHPNIHGVQRIADRLTERIRQRISV